MKTPEISSPLRRSHPDSNTERDLSNLPPEVRSDLKRAEHHSCVFYSTETDVYVLARAPHWLMDALQIGAAAITAKHQLYDHSKAPVLRFALTATEIAVSETSDRSVVFDAYLDVSSASVSEMYARILQSEYLTASFYDMALRNYITVLVSQNEPGYGLDLLERARAARSAIRMYDFAAASADIRRTLGR